VSLIEPPEFVFSRHAREEITRRDIPEEVVTNVLRNPEQTLALPNRRRVLQSRVALEDKMYLVRVIVAVQDEGQLVVTVYRTSKLGKYWRKE
jgi:hypothetical protein